MLQEAYFPHKCSCSAGYQFTYSCFFSLLHCLFRLNRNIVSQNRIENILFFTSYMQKKQPCRILFSLSDCGCSAGLQSEARVPVAVTPNGSAGDHLVRDFPHLYEKPKAPVRSNSHPLCSTSEQDDSELRH